MSKSTQNSEHLEFNRGVEALREHLDSIPFVHFDVQTDLKEVFVDSLSYPGFSPSVSSRSVWHGLLRLRLPLGEILAALVWKNNGEIGTVRLAAQELQLWRNQWIHGHTSPAPRSFSAFALPYGIVLAPYISPRASQLCRELGVGYCDLAGNCFLSFGQVYILRENWPNPAKRSASTSLWATKSQRVLRVLLENPARFWKTQDLAEAAGVSLGQVSGVRVRLSDREWVQSRETGFRVSEPLALLQEWAREQKRKQPPVSTFYSLDKVGELERRLAIWGGRRGQKIALTEYSGAARIAPYARYSQVSAWVEGEIEQLKRDLDLRVASSGANVRLLLANDEGVFHGAKSCDATLVASPVQLYLDLCALGSRGEDAARYLLENAIVPQWEKEKTP